MIYQIMTTSLLSIDNKWIVEVTKGPDNVFQANILGNTEELEAIINEANAKAAAGTKAPAAAVETTGVEGVKVSGGKSRHRRYKNKKSKSKSRKSRKK